MERRQGETCPFQQKGVQEARGRRSRSGRGADLPCLLSLGTELLTGLARHLRPLHIMQGPCTERAPRGWINSGQESSPQGQSRLGPEE